MGKDLIDDVELDSELNSEELGGEEENASEVADHSVEGTADALLEAAANADEGDDGTSLEDAEQIALEGSELEGFESANIEQIEVIEDERLDSIVESLLFATDKAVGIAALKVLFKGTNVNTARIRKAMERLAVELAGARRGVSLEEVSGGYQIRTKAENQKFLTKNLKGRPFRLSGPALEVLAIAAYKQPIVKNEIDQIRGVESGHLLRALLEKGLVHFEGKSELPGKPMLYGTTRKFLEIFGLRSVKELPTLSQIDEILPEGIGDDEEKTTLDVVTSEMSQAVGSKYSEGEVELNEIQDQLAGITNTTDFFEKEKQREKLERDKQKADNLREAIAFGEPISNFDKKWLERYDKAQAVAAAGPAVQSNDGAPNDAEGIDPDKLAAAEAAEPMNIDELDESLDMELAELDEEIAEHHVDDDLNIAEHDDDDEDQDAQT